MKGRHHGFKWSFYCNTYHSKIDFTYEGCGGCMTVCGLRASLLFHIPADTAALEPSRATQWQWLSLWFTVPGTVGAIYQHVLISMYLAQESCPVQFDSWMIICSGQAHYRSCFSYFLSNLIIFVWLILCFYTIKKRNTFRK